MKEIAKAYNHQEFEEEIYRLWESKGYFKPEVNPDGQPFCCIMPPPNANGSLHIGHALFIAIQDLMTRYARLLGKAALWLPGADHAGFETQVVFEKQLEKQGTSRFNFTRDELYQKTLEFTLSNKKNMENQIRRMGSSCDWDREVFTLDESVVAAVEEAFVKLYEDGLAYRAIRLVNWCPKHQTSLSDLEVESIERDDYIYEIKYGPITVATTRPETLFGDSAVAVHPKDKKYKNLVGQEINLPLTNRKIKIIADEAIELGFGTGAVKITPAHDPLDFEISQRHDLELIEVIDDRGRIYANPKAEILPEVAELLQNKKVGEARELTLSELEKRGLLVSTKPHHHSVGVCYKCGNTIEPMPKEQWYIAVNKPGKYSGKTWAKDALAALDDGRVKFVSERFDKQCRFWLENLRDWNISRQIVWGIQIPAWYRLDKVSGEREVFVGREAPEGDDWTRDPDVFDTWFSSSQWPYLTLQNDGAKGDFEKFYPTTVMETGYDIIFFWVARMMMMGLYFTGKAPFESVYIHGLVRDKNNQKMSKSKGNVINPIDVADLYGTDAVRMALIFGTSPGADSSISEEKIKGMRNLSNKIWNASRFVMLRVSDGDLKSGEIGISKLDNLNIEQSLLTEKDAEILAKHKEIKTLTTKKLDEYKYSQAGEELYDYFWHQFCDQYIETAKTQLEDDRTAKNTKKVLIKVLTETLQMLHPFVPFVTEAVWQELRNIYPRLDESIMISKWPK